MKVVAATVRAAGGQLPRAVANARTEWQERQGLLLDLTDEDGVRGLGEASPLPGYSPDTLAACRAGLEALAGALPLALDLASPPAAQLQACLEPIPAELPAARMALETALLDLAGKRLGTSVAALLGGPPGASVPLAALLPDGELGGQITNLERGLTAGLRTFKLKVGRPGRFAKELETIRALRCACPGEWSLRLDVNGAWGLDEARDHLAVLAGEHVELVEQPVAPELLFELTGSPVPLAADETVRLPRAVERLAASGACRAVVLKPMVLGGLLRCLDLARRARDAGMGVIVTHLFDGPVALAAACELALALDPPPLACGLAPHPALAAWPAVRPPQLRGDRIVPHAGAGHGVTLELPA